VLQMAVVLKCETTARKVASHAASVGELLAGLGWIWWLAEWNIDVRVAVERDEIRVSKTLVDSGLGAGEKCMLGSTV